MAIPAQKRIEGKYEILQKLSEGGMGAVYKVRHRLLEEIRVVKVMRPQMEATEDLKTRFLREAKVAVRMRHTNIAQLYDFTIDDDGTAFMVMEFVDGMDLTHLLRNTGPLQIGLLLDVGIQSLQALQYLHRRKVVHRDISPDNLMLTKDDEGQPLVKLIDLGIAKALAGDVSLTKSGFFIGKIRYASPEQFGGAKGDAKIDHRSDLYSLGVVLYELMTGEHPIGGTDHKSLLAGHLFHPPMDFAESDPTGRVPTELRTTILKALEKNPPERFPDAKDFSSALEKIKKRWKEEAAQEVATSEPTLLMPGAGPEGLPVPEDQHELDERFVPEPTPTPSPIEAIPATEAVDPRAASHETRQRIETLIQAGRLTEAEQELRRVTGSGLQDPIFEGLNLRLRDLQGRVQGILDQGRLLKESGNLEGAFKELQKARGIDAGNVEANDLIADIEKALEERARAAQEARKVIEEHLTRGDFTAASRKLAEAIRTLGAVQDFSDLGGRLEELRAQEKRAQAITKASQRIERLFEQRRLDKAAEILTAAVQELGDDEVFDDLTERIEAIQTQRRQVDALVRGASALADAENFPDAIEKLEEARRLDPQDSEVQELLARCRASLEQDRRKRQQALAQLKSAANVGKLLERGDLQAAEQALSQAIKELGPGESFETLQIRLQDFKRKRRDDQAAELLDRAERLMETGRLEASRVAVQECLALNPEQARAKALLAEIEERKSEKARALAAAEARRIVEGHLDEGALSEASKALTSAVREHGAVEDFGDLRHRLDELKATATRNQEIARTAAKIEALLSRKQIDRAAIFLKGAMQRHGEQEALQVLGKQIEEAQAQRKLRELERERARAARPQTRRVALAVVMGAVVVLALAGIIALRTARPTSDTLTEPVAPEPPPIHTQLAGIDFGSYHALVIGNNAYRQGLTQLETAVSDAEALAGVLEGEYGFRVTLLRNATRYEILSTLENLTQGLTDHDNLLLYYAGHGYLNPENRQGYWQPIDAEPDNPANWISSLDVADILLDASIKRVLVVADSCFSAALAGPDTDAMAVESRAVQTLDELKTVLGKRARLAITSGNLQPVLDTGTGDRSVFASALLEVLEGDPGFREAGTVFEEVSTRVTEAATRLGGDQIPQYVALETDDGGAFFFVPQSLLES